MKKILVIALALGVLVAAAPAYAWEPLDLKVKNSDTAVTNAVTVSASTGGNLTNGGWGGNGGKSGKVKAENGSTGESGNGGNGGNGGDGGTVNTGDAEASSDIYNDVNSTKVKSCDCDLEGDVAIRVKNRRTEVTSAAAVGAETGLNASNGGDGGAAGKSGKVKAENGSTSTSGNGGNGGEGGWGGEIQTGQSKASSYMSTKVNRTRISR